MYSDYNFFFLEKEPGFKLESSIYSANKILYFEGERKLKSKMYTFPKFREIARKFKGEKIQLLIVCLFSFQIQLVCFKSVVLRNKSF